MTRPRYPATRRPRTDINIGDSQRYSGFSNSVHNVQQLIEPAPSSVGRALGPQQEKHPVARDPTRPGGCQQRQENEPLALVHRGRDYRVMSFDRQSAKGSEREIAASESRRRIGWWVSKARVYNRPSRLWPAVQSPVRRRPSRVRPR